MIRDKCKHGWEKHTNFKQNLGASTHLCKKCNTNMATAEVFQLEALENQSETLKYLKGFQKYIAIIALTISFLVLVFSIITPIFNL